MEEWKRDKAMGALGKGPPPAGPSCKDEAPGLSSRSRKVITGPGLTLFRVYAQSPPKIETETDEY